MTTEQQFQHINESLRKLLKQHAALKKENALLKAKLEQENILPVNKVETAETKLDLSNFNADQKKYLQQLIDQYLKEIDNCMAMLNTQ